MNLNHIISLILFSMIVSSMTVSCHTHLIYEQKLNSWTGKDLEMLENDWGSSPSRYTLKDGRWILEYVDDSFIQLHGFSGERGSVPLKAMKGHFRAE